MLLANGNRTEARTAFTTANATSPGFVQADLALVQLDVAEGKLVDAHKRLLTIASSSTSPPLVNLWLGNIEEMQGAHTDALEHFRKAVQANPQSAQAANNLAYLTADSGGNLEEALKYAQKAVELAPNHAAYSDTLGWILYRKGVYPTSVQYLEKASSDPGNVIWKYHLAMAYAKAGDLNRGRSMLQAALKLNPNVPEAKVAGQILGLGQ